MSTRPVYVVFVYLYIGTVKHYAHVDAVKAVATKVTRSMLVVYNPQPGFFYIIFPYICECTSERIYYICLYVSADGFAQDFPPNEQFTNVTIHWIGGIAKLNEHETFTHIKSILCIFYTRLFVYKTDKFTRSTNPFDELYIRWNFAAMLFLSAYTFYMRDTQIFIYNILPQLYTVIQACCLYTWIHLFTNEVCIFLYVALFTM